VNRDRQARRADIFIVIGTFADLAPAGAAWFIGMYKIINPGNALV